MLREKIIEVTFIGDKKIKKGDIIQRMRRGKRDKFKIHLMTKTGNCIKLWGCQSHVENPIKKPLSSGGSLSYITISCLENTNYKIIGRNNHSDIVFVKNGE